MFVSIPSRRIKPINFLPMISVVFLLLMFFILTGNFSPNSLLPIDFPKAQSPQEVPKASLRVSINKHHVIAFEDKIVTFDRLPDIVAAKLANDPNQPILIQADKDLPAVELTHIISLFEAVGAHNIKLMTIAP
ncbi:MAG: biopolymer transporter ExbD [Alphaproteobacteria bacterium]|nr:biopolymer transporter ExbD [Alphaproteobacteria bacterium]